MHKTLGAQDVNTLPHHPEESPQSLIWIVTQVPDGHQAVEPALCSHSELLAVCLLHIWFLQSSALESALLPTLPCTHPSSQQAHVPLVSSFLQ